RCRSDVPPCSSGARMDLSVANADGQSRPDRCSGCLKMLEQRVEVAPGYVWRSNGQRELPVRPSEGTSSSHELVAEGAKTSKDEHGGASRCGAAALGLGA